ncbi:MAG: glycosyltransferase [Oscillibacter sp.]|nr:glycosyltransferase [Oscillibacter sp.]
MKFSFIVPVYNVLDYLEQCVASLEAVAVDKEILLVDDGSTDGSGALCDSLAAADGDIRVLHKKNGGLSSARNHGILHAAGDYLVFVDSDDFLDRAETERMLSSVHSTYPVAVGLYANYYDDGKKTSPEASLVMSRLSGEVETARFLTEIRDKTDSDYLVAVRFVVSRAFIMANDLLFREGIYHEDEEWTCRLLPRTQKLWVAPCYFYQYRQQRPGAITSKTTPRHLFDTLTIMDSVTAEIDRGQDAPRTAFLQSRRAGLFMNCLLNLYVLNEEQYQQVFHRLSEYLPRCRRYLPGSKGRILASVIAVSGLKNACALVRHQQRKRRAL